jgi:hypothetical protein
MRQRNGQPSSRVVALVVAVGNLVLCGGVVAVLVVARETSAASDSSPGQVPSGVTTTTESTTSSTWDYPTTTAEPVPSAGFRQVTGPGGMTTHIPATWPTKIAPGPGAMQADDAAGMARILRYGGSATTVTDSYQLHADYERQFAASKSNFVPIRLDRADVRGNPAIDWEFEYTAADGPRHVRSVYWLSNGYEYFVYASSPAGSWPATQQILDVMIVYSTP